MTAIRPLQTLPVVQKSRIPHLDFEAENGGFLREAACLGHSGAPASFHHASRCRTPSDRPPNSSGASSMVQNQRGEYLSLRREFEPTTVTLVIVAESPPASGKFITSVERRRR